MTQITLFKTEWKGPLPSHRSNCQTLPSPHPSICSVKQCCIWNKSWAPLNTRWYTRVIFFLSNRWLKLFIFMTCSTGLTQVKLSSKYFIQVTQLLMWLITSHHKESSRWDRCCAPGLFITLYNRYINDIHKHRYSYILMHLMVFHFL